MQATQWREQWAGTVRTAEDLVRFVDAVGCCTKLSLPRYPDFPTHYAAMGDHYASTDTWFWKDDLHAEKRLYYTRVFAGQPGFLSYALLPAVIATNGAVVDELLFTGALSVEAQEIYHAIDVHGPIGIKDLKRLLTADAKRIANRVLIDLERRFIITKTGITGRERGTYGYIWDLVERWIPDMLLAADRLGSAAAADLLRGHLADFGIPFDSPFYAKALGWTR
ncbi:MAG TPA: hypothetical protein VGL77_05485 [Armatimonadota bacterium]|jgi:hypothetical protein